MYNSLLVRIFDALSTWFAPCDSCILTFSAKNECDPPGVCDQICTDLKLGYRCDCVDGYSPLPNDSSCRVNGKPRWVLHVNWIPQRMIESLYLVPGSETPFLISIKSGNLLKAPLNDDLVVETTPTGLTDSALSVDVDMVNQEVIIIDMRAKKLLAVSFNGQNSRNVRKLHFD